MTEQPISPQLFPGMIGIYQLDHPLDIALPVDDQIAIIYQQARLAQYNDIAPVLSGLNTTESLFGLTFDALLRKQVGDNAEGLKAGVLKCLRQFVENQYRLEDFPTYWRINGEQQLFKTTCCGFIEDGRLVRMLVLHKNESNAQQQDPVNSSLIVNAEAEKLRREQQQRIFIDNSASGMFVVDIDPPMPLKLGVHQQVQWIAEHSKFTDANRSFLSLFRFHDLDKLLGLSLFHSEVGYDFATTARDFISSEFQFQDYLIRFHHVLEELWVSVNASGVIREGHLVQVLGMMTDVSERIHYSQEMEYRARHDTLTGLPNRTYFIDLVNQAKKLAGSGCRHALFLLDLDGFKEVNDTLGHEMGDYLLKQIGPRFEGILSPSRALLARLGGDEFAVFVEDYQNIDVITQLALDLMAAIKTPFAINELELVIGGSIGIALYPENAETVSSLMRCADVAMYRAKKDSVDYRFYAVEQDHYTVRRLSLMMDIRSAILNDELQLHYQPIVNLYSQTPVSFEALIRWQHPVHGLLPPGEFIPLIEITDMIVPVTTWVIETAIKQLSQWKQHNWPFRISVNVSTRNLIDTGFINFIEACLRRYAVDGQYLEIEITESTLIADPEKARRLLQSLAALGVRISIDDYGTGYSSLSYLKSLPINTLKIDRAFISQMLDDSHDQIIVNSTIQLAHNLGLDVTAEGIEELSLVDALLKLGCDKGQGYYFCKPIPVPDLESWLQAHGVVSMGRAH